MDAAPSDEGLAPCADELLRHTALGLLPMMCTGLSLLGCFTRTVARKLLPAIPSLLARLHESGATRHGDGANDERRSAKSKGAPALDSEEDFNLSRAAKFESPHPYVSDGQPCDSSEFETRPQGSSNCVWIQLDPRCATIESEARLEIWAGDKLLHTFAGGRGKWPRKPLVVTAVSVLLRFRVERWATRGAEPSSCWGVACTVCDLEPSLTPNMPLALDCQKSLASLGGKYAATLLVGEPLTPEERVHAMELEALRPTAECDGINAWAGCRLPSGVRQVLYEKRQRRAVARAEGLDAVAQLLDASPARTVQRHIFLWVAQALQALQHHDAKGRHRCQFLHGCRGCDFASWERVSQGVARLLCLSAARLTEELDALEARNRARDTARGEDAAAREDAAVAAAAVAAAEEEEEEEARFGGREDFVLVLLNVFLLRLQPGDLAMLDEACLLPMLARLQTARGRVQPVCRRLFKHLLLCAFAGASEGSSGGGGGDGARGDGSGDGSGDDASLTSVQVALLSTMHAEVRELLCKRQWGRAGTEVGMSGSLASTLSLLHSLSSRHAVCRFLGDAWLPTLVELLRDGCTGVATRVLRLLRAVLPTRVRPELDAVHASLAGMLPRSDRTHGSGKRAADGLKGSSLLVLNLLEAIGREVAGDEPSVARCVRASGDSTAAARLSAAEEMGAGEAVVAGESVIAGEAVAAGEADVEGEPEGDPVGGPVGETRVTVGAEASRTAEEAEIRRRLPTICSAACRRQTGAWLRS